MTQPIIRVTHGPNDGGPPIGPFITLSVPVDDQGLLTAVGVLMTPAEAAETAQDLLALAEDCINAERAGRRS